jgi:hypothetical protein
MGTCGDGNGKPLHLARDIGVVTVDDPLTPCIRRPFRLGLGSIESHGVRAETGNGDNGVQNLGIARTYNRGNLPYEI